MKFMENMNEYLINFEIEIKKKMSCGHYTNYIGFQKETHSKAQSLLPWIEILFLKH